MKALQDMWQWYKGTKIVIWSDDVGWHAGMYIDERWISFDGKTLLDVLEAANNAVDADLMHYPGRYYGQ